MKKIIIFIVLIFVGKTVSAQKAWTLQQCIDYAWKYNPSLKQSSLNNDINEVNYTQSKATILPTLNAGASHTYNNGQKIDPYTNKFASSTVLSENFYAQAQVTLWSGLQQYNNVKKNQYTYLSTKETYEQQKNDLALNVASSFLQVVYNIELQKVAQQQVNISSQQLERTQKLADAGSVAISSVYDMKAQLASDQYALVTAENNYNLSILALKQLLYLDTLNDFTIEKPALELSAADLAAYKPQDIYQTALQTQHKIKSAEYNLMSAEKNLSLAKGKISPSLSMSGTLGTGYSGLDKTIESAVFTGTTSTGYYTSSGEEVVQPTFNTVTKTNAWGTQFKNNLNKSIGLSLYIPLFNGLSTASAIKIAKLQMLSNKYNYDITKQQLYKTIAQAYADAQASLNKYAAAKMAYDASMQSFSFAEQKFNAGALNSFDYNNSKNRTIKTQTDMLNAKYDFVFKLKVLDFYQGKSLTF